MLEVYRPRGQSSHVSFLKENFPAMQLVQSAPPWPSLVHVARDSAVHAPVVELPGRELGRVGKVPLHRWHVALEVAPRTSEKVLAGHFTQSPLFSPLVLLKYVPAGQFSGTPAPRPQ